ncbi:hypothetical protein [Bacillus phage vB_BanS-Thrax1]|nr:hypothetical protein [Bacillus phage vB_BanS-Thrax1]
MRKFTVRYKEIIYKEVTIEAKTPDDAEEMVENRDFTGAYQTDSRDLVVTEVEEIV